MRLLPTRNSSACPLEMSSEHNPSVFPRSLWLCGSMVCLKSCEFLGGYGNCSWPFSLSTGNASVSQFYKQVPWPGCHRKSVVNSQVLAVAV